MRKNPTPRRARIGGIWLTVTVGAALSLAVLSTLGFRYTSEVLLSHVVDTLYFGIVLLLVHQMILRWLVLSRRQLAVQATMARRKAAADAEEAKTSGDAGVAGETVDEPELDLVALGDDTRELLFYFILGVAAVGLWIIWSEVLPAFRYLDQVRVSSRIGTVDGESIRLPVTLGDALLALLIAIMSLVVARRLPGLLEIAVLQRLHLTSGARYAARTLSSYAIVVVGFWVALRMLGISWSQLQWLVAALSVGIGFGLQEIVANFISGLIILFERPIRVGDIVSVGETDGVVTRIRMRATTIRNWERKELLVPNKEFITNRLLNWSLSDQTTRILIQVGLAYGGDVPRAMSLMAAAAEDHAHVLRDPAPFVCFEGFGDNALILNLRCFTDNLEHRLRTRSELNEKINAAFTKAGLVIAFQQRDVHLDVSTPLQIRVHHDTNTLEAKAATSSAPEDLP